MDIVCPNCAAAYRVPDSLLAGGKPLRCAACGHEWVPGAPQPAEAVPLAEPRALPEADVTSDRAPRSVEGGPMEARPDEVAERPPLVVHDQRPPVSARARQMERPLALTWLASLSLVATTLVAITVYRHEIAAAWPPFQRIVALLGG